MSKPDKCRHLSFARNQVLNYFRGKKNFYANLCFGTNLFLKVLFLKTKKILNLTYFTKYFKIKIIFFLDMFNLQKLKSHTCSIIPLQSGFDM